MCGLITKVALHELWLSVAVWPRGLGSDKHTNKEETRGERRERPSQGLLQHICQNSFHKKSSPSDIVNNYLWLDIIIIYVKTRECEALNYLCFQGAEGGDTY